MGCAENEKLKLKEDGAGSKVGCGTRAVGISVGGTGTGGSAVGASVGASVGCGVGRGLGTGAGGRGLGGLGL